MFICRKLYKQDMQESCFLDRRILDQNYPATTCTGSLSVRLSRYWKKTNLNRKRSIHAPKTGHGCSFLPILQGIGQVADFYSLFFRILHGIGCTAGSLGAISHTEFAVIHQTTVRCLTAR